MRNFYIFLVIFVFIGCNVITEPTPPERKNPIDPQNPNFQPPRAEVVSGPNDNSTVTTHTVTFQWRGNQADSLMLFSFKLDNQNWSEWSQDKTVTYEYLDEGKHTFYVKAKYVNNIEQQTPTVVNFTVDAIKGPSLMFIPRKSVVDKGSVFEVGIFAEESVNFAGAKIVVSYDFNLFQLDNVEIYKDTRSILLKNGGTVIDFIETTTGKVIISVAVAGGNPNNVNGTGAIGSLRFKVKDNVSSQRANLVFTNETIMRDSDNNTIQIKELVPGIVEIK